MTGLAGLCLLPAALLPGCSVPVASAPEAPPTAPSPMARPPPTSSSPYRTWSVPTTRRDPRVKRSASSSASSTRRCCASTAPAAPFPPSPLRGSRRDDGRNWEFTLRPDATFWDGTPVSASDVASSWTSAGGATSSRDPRIVAVTAAAARTVRVELNRSVEPVMFAAPHLAIARPRVGDAWPAGTGPYRPAASAAGTLRIVRRDTLPGRTVGAPRTPSTIEFRTRQDARTALDAASDVVITHDAVALDYARVLPGYVVVPLGWRTTYALVTDAGPAPDDDIERALADLQQATRAHARAARPPFWWRDPRCGDMVHDAPSGEQAPASRRFVHPRGDPVARDIAERLAALAWPADRVPAWLAALLPAGHSAAAAPNAAGLDGPALADALRTGVALGFVLPLPRTDAAPCLAAALLYEPARSALHAPRWRITPLLDVRDQLVHRAGAGRIVIDGDGVIVFAAGAR
jgi:hypothetical protein